MKWAFTTTPIQRRQFPLRLLPSLSDKYASSGIASGHYFHQDLWAARHIYIDNPIRHIDVGSRVDGFISHLLCFRDVEILDIRPLVSNVQGLHFHQVDLMSEATLTIQPSPSVSCLHALEHFGLGRYGDTISPDGWRTGLRRLSEIVVSGGFLYLSVPIGKASVEFNAQRIFDPRYIIEESLRNGLELISFSYVDDEGNLHETSTTLPEEDIAILLKLHYGCGLFKFIKH